MININIFKKPKTRRILKILIITIVSLVLFASVSVFSFIKYLSYYMNTPISNVQSTVDMTIEKGEGVRVIVQELQDKGLIKHKNFLLLYLKYKGIAGELRAGDYNLSHDLSPIEIVEIITDGDVKNRKITIPEGWTNVKIAEYLDEQNVVSKEEFLNAAKASYNYDFLQGIPEGVDLEGFLFPDTYEISDDITASEIVCMMLDNFESKLSDEIRTQINNSGFTVYEVVTLASIVEREVATPDDRGMVAGVFLNRLDIDMPLESCATIQYILNKNEKQFTYEETRTSSPYNTYLNKGLPVGPIGNPGVDSIKAVLNPTESNYLYFLSANGKTYFSETLDEHNQKKAQYL